MGQTVSASQPLTQVENLDSIWIEAHVPSQEARSIRQDAKGIASLLANPDLRFPVVLSRISPIVNESTRTQRIWLTLDPKAEIPQVLSGALITVHLSVGDATSSLAIPHPPSYATDRVILPSFRRAMGMSNVGEYRLDERMANIRN